MTIAEYAPWSGSEDACGTPSFVIDDRASETRLHVRFILRDVPSDARVEALLTGKKIVLRAVEREDLEFLHKWQNDEDLMRLARSFPDHTISAVALEAKYEKILKGEEVSEREYIFEEKEIRKPIGWARISLHHWPRSGVAHSADVGLVVGEKDRWKKGYGTEVVQLLLKEAFEQLNLHKVVWWTFAENAASLALARKMGFREECRVRDSVFFDNTYHDGIGLGLLKREYEAALRDSSAAVRRR